VSAIQPVQRAARLVATALAALWLSLFAAGTARAEPSFPQLTGRVVDQAGVLSADTQAQLTSMLAQQDKQTGVQVVVVTLKSLQGYAIEDFGYQLGRKWGIGQKGKNNGALLIIAPNEHKARIEVGYGLEGQLTDAQSRIIIDEIMIPDFKRGDYDKGALDGTAAILKVIGGATLTPEQDDSAPAGDNHHGSRNIPVIFIIVILWIVFGRFLWPLFFLGGMFGGRGGWGGGGFGGGSWGGGGGGFSGGGGSFGGGGASGSW